MPRYPQSLPGDEPCQVELDNRFLGVNERDDAGALTTDGGSYVAEAINCRFRTGEPETRGGYVRPVPLHVPSVVGSDTGFNGGAGTFTDDRGREWVCLVRWIESEDPDGQVIPIWFARMGEYPQRTETAALWASPVRPVPMQAGEEMIIWRSGEEPLHWSGDFTDAWVASSEAEVPAEYPTYLAPLPSADFGIYMEAAARVVFPVPDAPGEIGWTDIAAPRRWDSALSRDAVVRGTITGLAEWGTTLVVFTETAVAAITNFTGDLSSRALEPVTDQAGCIAHRTITEAGGDLLFLGRGGVYRLTEVLASGAGGQITSRRQMTPVPVSWPIPKSMERINWAAASIACACLADGLWYLSVPVDGASYNNGIFVYDTVSGQWQGEDALEAWTTEDELSVRDLVRGHVYGVESPLVVDQYAVYAGGHGWHDGDGAGDIRTLVKARGYVLEEVGLKVLTGLEVITEELGTEDITLSAYCDGIRERQAVQTALTRDRRKYQTFGRADRTLANTGDDFDEPNRQDYAWVAGETQTETATVTGTITGSGNAVVTVTAAGMTGSPIATNVAVLAGDTAAEVAAKIITALRLVANITARFGIYPHASGNKVILQRLIPAANDATCNVAIANGTCTGLTAAPTSANTTAGSASAEDVLQVGSNGIPLGFHQAQKLAGRVQGVARWVQPFIEAQAGRVRVKAVRAEGRKRRDHARL